MRLSMSLLPSLLAVLASALPGPPDPPDGHGPNPLSSANSTYYNPALSGWHSDPTCTTVDGTFFCVTSTFISFPGLPVYASKDLVNFKHVSHVWNRESQLPGLSWNTTDQVEGHFAATIRYHKDTFYVICLFAGSNVRMIGRVVCSALQSPCRPYKPSRFAPPWS